MFDKEGSIEGRSHDAMDQDGKNYVDKMEDYYITLDESKAVAAEENGINHSKNEKYYGSQANIKKVVEKKGRMREQNPKLGMGVLEPAEQCNKVYLSND